MGGSGCLWRRAFGLLGSAVGAFSLLLGQASALEGQTLPFRPNRGRPFSAKRLSQGVPAPAGAHLTYYGGPVISNVQVQVVFWTGGVSGLTQSVIESFYSDVTSSVYFDLLSEYSTLGGTNQVVGRGTAASSRVIAPGPSRSGTTVSDADIQAELSAQISAGTLPAPALDAQGYVNTLYMVYFPAGYTINAAPNVRSCVDFCAYNGTFLRNGAMVPYGVFPDVASGGCQSGCGSNATSFQNLTARSAAVLASAVTNPALGLAASVASPLAWYDASFGQAGDICFGQDGVLNFSGTTWTVQSIFSNYESTLQIAQACSFQSFAAGALTAGTIAVNASQGRPLAVPFSTFVAQTSGLYPPFSVALVVPRSDQGGSVAVDANSVTYTSPRPQFTGADSVAYLIKDSRGVTAVGAIHVTVVPPAYPPNPVALSRSAGGFSATFSGVPGLSYAIESNDTLSSPSTWTSLNPPGSVTADASGQFQFADPAAVSERFYRARALP